MMLIFVLNNLLKHSDKIEVNPILSRDKSMNKTQRVIQLFYSISNARKRTLHYEQIMPLLSKTENPLKDKNALKFLNELLEGSGGLPPILVKIGQGDKNKSSYKLNSQVWENFVFASNEGRFYFEAFKQLGQILETPDMETCFDYVGESNNISNLNRKFIYLSKIQAREYDQKIKTVIDDIVKSLVEDRLLRISYQPVASLEVKWRDIKPLSLCQYRDDLYLLCQKVEDNQWKFKTYKVSRIKDVEVKDENFSYPSLSEWDPENRYKNASGLVVGEIKTCMVRVHGPSRQVFEEKLIFNSRRIQWNENYSDFELTYSGINEFLGQLFVYAQDIEILEGEEIREKFIDKAKSALERNQVQLNIKKAS